MIRLRSNRSLSLRSFALSLATLGSFSLWADQGSGDLKTFGAPDPNAQFEFTSPIELDRLANEWEPQQALVLSISYPEAMEDLEVARNFASILDAAHPYLDIFVFGDQEKHRQYAHFLSLIDHHPRVEAIRNRTRFVDSRSLFRWSRDFGPIFGHGKENQLVAIDLVYRDMMKTLEEEALQLDEPLDPLRDFYNLNGDAMPAEVVATLHAEYDIPVDIVRAPVSMDGGDFIYDGQGNIFISRQTLIRNGGDRSALEDVFRRYFEAKKLHVLEALPGRTVPHLDMIVKFLDSETIVLPEFEGSLADAVNPYHADLIRNASRVIDKNERYLRKAFPNRTILKIPMPPILFNSREEIIAEAKQRFVKAVAIDKGIANANEVERFSNAQLTELERRVLSAIQKEIPSASFSSTESLDAVLKQYGQLPLDAFIARYSEPATRYRSYINSVFLHAEDGRQAFLVPQFTSSDSNESAQLKKWEAEVEKVYKSVWPNAAIHWINCDSMVSDLGFIHCATITVPLIKSN